jgi:hypothetical protein
VGPIDQRRKERKERGHGRIGPREGKWAGATAGGLHAGEEREKGRKGEKEKRPWAGLPGEKEKRRRERREDGQLGWAQRREERGKREKSKTNAFEFEKEI